MPKVCSICTHPERAEIENALLAIGSSSSITIEDVAEQYECDLNELKMHAMFHAPLLAEFDKESPEEAPSSLTRKIKLKEADTLAATSNEYLVTLKNMGRRLNRLINVSSIDAEEIEKQVQLAKLLTKPMVELYLGLGNEIRQNVKTMAELDRILNGPQDNGLSGLAALASAIRGSDVND